jgi:N-acetyl sugar amidotransferase
MRIFIDIGHPAHVHYFRNFIKIMEKKGHVFFISARNRSIIHYLLEKYNIGFWDRGKGYNNIVGKIIYMLVADIRLFKKSLHFKPDIFVSFASPYAAQVAWISGKPHIVLDDTEHTRFAPFFYKPFSKAILNPFCYQIDSGPKQVRFNSFTELFYLHANFYFPNPDGLKLLNILESEKFVILRFVSWKALHDIGHYGLDLDTKKKLVSFLENKGYKIFISNEPDTIEPIFEKYLLKIPPEYIHDILYYADLLVSESGTMASEAAILGTPVVYVNSLPLMGYLQEEQKHGLLSPFSSSSGVIEKVTELLSFHNLKEICHSRRQSLLAGKIDLTDFLVWFVENFPSSLGIIKENPDYQIRFLSKTHKEYSLQNRIDKELKICSRCILDTTVGDIWFNEKGECKYCKIHDEMELNHPLDSSSERKISELIAKIKYNGRKKSYDCIAGVSGGRDSTYTLYKAVKLGLRPLAVHFDNGWNTEISVKNIKKACEKLNVPLYTVVADWEEFKDLQIAFLKASTPDADVPTDYAIYSVLYDVARKEGIRYILNGHSFRTEGTSPISWTYMDPLYVSSVHKRFGKLKKFKSFPHMTFFKLIWFLFVKGIREVRLMEYIDYRQKGVDQILIDELGWEYYGGHHHENMYTKFFQSYFLPTKFNIDKRKTELSALIRSGQMSREEALKEIRLTSYKFETDVVTYAINKLGLTQDEFSRILNEPVKSHDDYHTYLALMRILQLPIKIAARFKLLPQILYLKYARQKF